MKIYDPKVNEDQIELDLISKQSSEVKDKDYGTFEKVDSIHESVINSDAIIIITEWSEFKDLNFLELIKVMRKPSWIFDSRGIINKTKAISAGFNVWEIGVGGEIERCLF